MKLYVTVLEESMDAATRAIRAIDGRDHDGVEVRAERFPFVDCAGIRAATSKPIILTFRNVEASPPIEAAIAAGIDFIDVEWGNRLDRALIEQHRERIVLSHHDYQGMRDVEAIVTSMLELRCAHVKLAATPGDFADNERLLRLLEADGSADRTSAVTVIGMGEHGLYSRLLAPFRGAALTFVAAEREAAPGQLTLENALEIYGAERDMTKARDVFAVVGNPAGHSRSPSIHNRLFRQKGVAAAYSIASIESFAEIEDSFLRGEPMGLSITAPFKDDALRFAERTGARISPNAEECKSVNTLVNDGSALIADNTDVDGFEALLARVEGRERKSVAIVGAGATARAALLAVQRAAMPVTLFNRTAGKSGALPLAELQRWNGEVIIDATSGEVELPLRPGMTLVRAAYGVRSAAVDRAATKEVQSFDGLDLLEAQAVRQNDLFVSAIRRRRQREGVGDE